MSTPKYAMRDTAKPDGFYIQEFQRVVLDDDENPRPDTRDAGFWPSQDKDAAGYCGDMSATEFAAQHLAAKERMAAWERGDWNFVGVRARALCLVVCNGAGVNLSIDSPGLWGIESDSGESYLSEVYGEECNHLQAMIAAMKNPIYETAPPSY